MIMIEDTLNELAAQGFIPSPKARKAIRDALADYAFCATIDSAIREEAHQTMEEVAKEEEEDSYISPFTGKAIRGA